VASRCQARCQLSTGPASGSSSRTSRIPPAPRRCPPRWCHRR
jgi:hypothetical protein